MSSQNTLIIIAVLSGSSYNKYSSQWIYIATETFESSAWYKSKYIGRESRAWLIFPIYGSYKNT